VLSSAFPILALVRVERATGTSQLRGDPMRELASAVEILARRQRPDGAIGFWSADDWSTPWLSAYAGHFLLDARAAGVPVSDSMLVRLAEYLSAAVREADVRITPVMWRTIAPSERLRERVAAADFLSRMGRPDVAAENELLRTAAQMMMEDRARLAETLARRGAMGPARALLEPIWALTRVEGRRAVVPDSVSQYDFYFRSTLLPAARLLTATLAVDSAHALIGPLVETIVQQQRAQGRWGWTTQDYGAAVVALAEFERRQRGAAERGLRVRGGRRVLFDTRARAAGDSTIALGGLLEPARGETQAVRLTLESDGGAPTYYYLTIREVPLEPPVRPDEEGIRVERWYERFDRAQPIVSAAEGDLVRVRLRITVPRDRQFVVVDDALPAGLEAIDLGLRTASALPGPGAMQPVSAEGELEGEREHVEGAESGFAYWAFGSWDSGWWSPFDHKEIRDDRVVYFATVLWPGTYTATYLARATTPGTFVRPPAHAEEMYNPAVRGRTEGGVFTVTPKSR
jgi:uncharacterized protein YfaS (alpha-2-macroglobulin family)